jgi:hypothetical protein
LHGDAIEVHGDQGAGDRQQQDRSDDQAAAQSHEDHQHEHHDDHCRNQVGHESIDGGAHRIRLVGHGIQLHADRSKRVEFVETCADRVAHVDDVAPETWETPRPIAGWPS